AARIARRYDRPVIGAEQTLRPRHREGGRGVAVAGDLIHAAGGGGPRGPDRPDGHQRHQPRGPDHCAGPGRATCDTNHGAPPACRWRRRADMCAMSGGPRPSPSSSAAARAISVTRRPSPRLAEADVGLAAGGMVLLAYALFAPTQPVS